MCQTSDHSSQSTSNYLQMVCWNSTTELLCKHTFSPLHGRPQTATATWTRSTIRLIFLESRKEGEKTQNANERQKRVWGKKYGEKSEVWTRNWATIDKFFQRRIRDIITHIISFFFHFFRGKTTLHFHSLSIISQTFFHCAFIRLCICKLSI